jgi:hypothetical protein
MAGYVSLGRTLFGVPYCRVCGRGTSETVDLNGAICTVCLRRINADPQAKRRVMFGWDQFDW